MEMLYLKFYLYMFVNGLAKMYVCALDVVFCIDEKKEYISASAALHNVHDCSFNRMTHKNTTMHVSCGISLRK